jgi:hypothetical protein
MARFRLTGKHYLHTVPGTEWEQKEVDATTGRQAIRRYPVPLHLDPDNPADHNYPGEIIVSTKADRAHPRDIVFKGPPTPDMEPIDEEADKLIAPLRAKWEKNHPIESLPASGA